MDYNPVILSGQSLQDASLDAVIRAQYAFTVASVSFVLCLVGFYTIFKILVWFLPNFSYKESSKIK
jgi:hypothetical protein